MAKTYKTYLPEQDLLLPPSLRDWLPENHLVYCVSDVVDQLDLSAIESVYEEGDRGQPPYHRKRQLRTVLTSRGRLVATRRGEVLGRFDPDVPVQQLFDLFFTFPHS